MQIFKISHLFLVCALVLAVSAILITQKLNQQTQAQRPIVPSQLRGEYDPIQTNGEFHGQLVASTEVQPTLVAQHVLGASNQDKHIEINLTTQRLYAFEGDDLIYEFLISSGKWYPTPTGTFTIWGKFRHTKMEGGNPGTRTYYYLPNVPYVMFFSNDEIAASRGFSLHGTYWHENFGHPMSHGCVNMKTSEAEQIYYWSLPALGDQKSIQANADNPGTKIHIYGEAPKE